MALILPTSIVREWAAGDSYSVDNTATGGVNLFITKAPGNAEYEEVLAWIAAGNTPEPEFTAAELLEQKRSSKISDITNEGLTRIAAVLPDLDTLAKVELVATLWPVLDNPASNPNFALARDIYVYARTKTNQARTATEAQLDAYDPTTDPNWPT